MRYLRTPRRAALDGLIALAILAPFAAWGCGGSSSGGAAPVNDPSTTQPAQTTRHVYPASFVVPDVPPGSWLRADVYVCTAAVASLQGARGLAEVDATPALRDARIAWPSTPTVGLPTGWRLVVMPPGTFTVYRDGVTPEAVVGITLAGTRTIYASLPTRARPQIVPVLAHEFGHAHLRSLGYARGVADANDHPLTPVPGGP